jgi:hypothetical protein
MLAFPMPPGLDSIRRLGAASTTLADTNEVVELALLLSAEQAAALEAVGHLLDLTAAALARRIIGDFLHDRLLAPERPG